MPTPNWQAARNGLPGDTNAIDKSAQINQLLGAHGVTPIYTGNRVVTAVGSCAGGSDPSNEWVFHLDAFDYDQPFPMSGTSIGRVVVPLLPVGAGADILVSLCADSSGTPGTVLAQARIPASWINAFSSVRAAAGPATQTVLQTATGPLVLPQFNTLQAGNSTGVNWASPTGSASGSATNPSWVMAGNYLILVGGKDPASGQPVGNVYTIGYGGGSSLTAAVPQPPVPGGVTQTAAMATPSNVVVAGGLINPTTSTPNVYVAGWSPNTGQLSAWSAQAALPQAVDGSAAASWNNTVYVIGGEVIGSGSFLNTVYFAAINNGQIGSWQTGPPLPINLFLARAAVVGNFLLVFGGIGPGGSTYNSEFLYAPINPDGSLGNWLTGPQIPTPIESTNIVVTPNGVVCFGGFTTGAGVTNKIQAISFSDRGPGVWNQQQGAVSAAYNPTAVFSNGSGQWQVFYITGTNFTTHALYIVPTISVPLNASGLTNGATYHILLQQQGGTSYNFLRTRVDSNVYTGNPTALFRGRGGGSWTTFTTGFAIPLSVYDNTAGGHVLHTWEDAGARITTLAYAGTPDGRLLGVAEAAQFADGSVLADVAAVTYPGTWPAGAWPPLGVTQL
jgi:hypothetical protein